MFAKRTEPISVEPLSDTPLLGRLLALSEEIRPDWKGLTRTNTLAYYEHLQISDIKRLDEAGKA
jgi:hypothetical protein